MHAAEEFDEMRRAEREDRTELDRRLLAACDDIRERATCRSGSSVPGDTTGTPQSHQKLSSVTESDDEMEKLFIQQGQEQKQSDAKCMKLDEERLIIERENVGRERENFTTTHDLAKKRFELDQRRLELEESRELRRVEIDDRREFADKEEQKVELMERKELRGVLSAIARKLA